MRLKPALILITMLPLAVTLTFSWLQVNDLLHRLDLTIADRADKKSQLLMDDLYKTLRKSQNVAISLAQSDEVRKGIKLFDADILYTRSQFFRSLDIGYISFINLTVTGQNIVVARSTDEFHFGDNLQNEPLLNYTLDLWNTRTPTAKTAKLSPLVANQGRLQPIELTTITTFDNKNYLLCIAPVIQFDDSLSGAVVVGVHLDDNFLSQLGKKYDVHLSTGALNNTSTKAITSLKQSYSRPLEQLDTLSFDYQFSSVDGKKMATFSQFTLFEDNFADRQSLTDLQHRVLFFMALLAIATLILSHTLIKKILRPVKQLIAAIDAHARSDKTVITVESPNNEIGDIATAFINMRDENLSLLAQLDTAASHSASANSAKSLFLANMSHEIRTPMNAILGYAQLLERSDNLDAKQSAFLHTINQAGKHLLLLINDILDLSKIEAGAMLHDPQDFDLNQLIGNLNEMFMYRCQEKNISWEITAGDGPADVIGDEKKLRQALINLIANAVKFTEQGRVSLQIIREAADQWQFIITDTGSGIDAEYLGAIFEPFMQSPSGLKIGGTGLGLSITKGQIEAMGSQLMVESIPQQGSVFFFTLTLPPSKVSFSSTSKPHNQPLPQLTVTDLTALVVDDNKDNRDLLCHLLMDIGFEVQLADNGLEALGQCEQSLPDIIFMDIAMPVMDGRTALAELIKRYPHQTITCVAVTASVLDSEKNAMLSNGFTDFVAKPFRLEDIYHSIIKVLELNDTIDQPNTKPYIKADNSHFSAVDQHKMAQIAIPQPLKQQLIEAIELSDIKEIENKLAKLAEIGNDEDLLSQYLARLLINYDFETMLTEVKASSHALK
ncbi:MAG: signal transduction histidine kinase/FixJ family two-component response regulator [Phenylobacterium sp.]|jgi:signal transduction histidine kinase/FixJ family two-component response regulator